MLNNRVRIPALVHHKATNQARVRLDGRDFYLGRFGTEVANEAYRRLIAEWLATGTTPQCNAARSSAGLSINELILAYFRFAEGYYVKNGKSTSELGLIKDTLRVLRELYGTTAAAEFSPLKLKAVREAMIAKGWCRSEINKRVGRVRRVFKWAVENELLCGSVLHSLQGVSGLRRGRSEAREPERVKPVAQDDVNAVLPFVAPQVRDMIRLQLLTGCRPGEICSLRPCDVKRDGDVWEYVPATHKTEHHGRDRVIFVGPKAQAILNQWLENRPAEAFCFSPSEAQANRNATKRQNRKTRVQPSQQNRRKKAPKRQPGQCYTNTSYRRTIARACELAGIESWAPNQLRHSRATWLRRQFGLEAAQVVLGHSSADVTQVYAERDFDAARKIMAEVG